MGTDTLERPSEQARVTCGANSIEVSAGITVADMLASRGVELNTPDSPQVLVGGKPVKENYRLQAQDQVEVVQPAGRKG